MLQFLEVAGCLSCQFHKSATEGGGAVEAAFVGDVLQSEFWVLLHERQARMPDGLGCMSSLIVVMEDCGKAHFSSGAFPKPQKRHAPRRSGDVGHVGFWGVIILLRARANHPCQNASCEGRFWLVRCVLSRRHGRGSTIVRQTDRRSCVLLRKTRCWDR